MAPTKMELAELLSKAEGADADWLREGVRVLAQALMDAEVSRRSAPPMASAVPTGPPTATAIGPGEWDTRVGTIELAIPRLRAGSYLPSWLEPRRRAERALCAVVAQCYVEGVSTRRVDDIARQMGIDGISKSQVSESVRDAPCVGTLTGISPRQGVEACHGGLIPVVVLPAFVGARRRAGLAGRPPGPPCHPAHPDRAPSSSAAFAGGPPGRGRRSAAGRAVVPARRPGGGDLQDRGGRQHGPAARPAWRPRALPPDGTFITTLAELGERLGEMACSGEAVCVDGLATRVQRLRGWASQKVLYDAKRHTHTAQGLAISTVWGDLPWMDGGWPGSCHEHELIELRGSLWRWVRDVFRAAGALVCLGRWLQRIPRDRASAGGG